MKVNKVFCLFEQSGTFKKAFKSLGIPAEDFDILNDFGETDRQIDLFNEIEKAYEGKVSIFDEVKEDDLIMAFFPCTRFQSYCCANMQGRNHGQRNWTLEQRLEYSMNLHKELHKLYTLICKLFLVAERGGLRLIVENPYTQPHYLTLFFPVDPKVIIKDRYEEGDYYSKPTQFFFLNCEPEQNIVMTPLEYIAKQYISNPTIRNGKGTQVNRSLIHPQFVDRFIKTYILTKNGGIWT